MAIQATIFTRGYGNGTFSGSIAFVILHGYKQLVAAKWAKEAAVAAGTWVGESGAAAGTWTEEGVAGAESWTKESGL